MTTRPITLVLILLLLFTNVRGQSSSPQQPGKPEEPAITEERTRSALALVAEILDETRSLKLPESRLRIEIALAGSLWSRDERRARSLFKEAVADLAEATAEIRVEDPESLNRAHMPGQLRQEILNVLMVNDPKLALDFLRSTSSGIPGQQSAEERQVQESRLEMGVAVAVVGRDPAEAFKIGEAALKRGLDYSAMNLLNNLQSRDRALGQRFLGSMLDRLRTEDFTKNGEASYVVMELLQNWINATRNRSQAQQADGERPVSILDGQAAMEVTRILIRVLLDDRTGRLSMQRFSLTHVSDVVQQLTDLMPDFARASAGQFNAVRKRLAELEKVNEAQNPGFRIQELVQSGTVEALLEAAKKAPPGYADSLIQNAMWKAVNEGDEVRAREIAEGIVNPRQRADSIASLNRHLATQAGEQKEIAKARTLLAGIPLIEERARMLAQLSMSASRGDKSLALELLGEAEALLGSTLRNYSQLGAQLQIAHAYSELDPEKRATIVGASIDRLDELAVAAEALDGFDIQQYFRRGELVLNGGNQLSSAMQSVAAELGSLAGVDLPKARSLADRFERREMRLVALVQIVAGALSAETNDAHLRMVHTRTR